MVELPAGRITSTLHKPHAVRVILVGPIIPAWESKILAANVGTLNGACQNVSRTAKKV